MMKRSCFDETISVFLIFLFVIWVSPAYAESKKVRIAVADFSLGGPGHDKPELGAILAELLTEELVRQGRVNVVERHLMKRLLDEKKLAMAGITSGDTAAAGALLDVDYILGGSDMRLGDTSDLTGRLIDVKTGIITASEDMPYHKDDELRSVARNLADMLGRNFDTNGLLLPKKILEVSWESFSSDNSHSRFIEKSGGRGTWSYKIKNGDDDYAGLNCNIGGKGIKGRNVLVTLKSQNGYPLYVRFYSFVPGFSREDNDETLVPVEKLVSIGKVALETEAPHHKMKVPGWWREENGAKRVMFNPEDIRQFELEASEDASEGSGKDVIEILRIAVQ